MALVCSVSRPYEKPDMVGYWYAYHSHQKEFLDKAEEAASIQEVPGGPGSEIGLVVDPGNEISPDSEPGGP